MTTSVIETGAVFKLVDEFSGPGRRLLELLSGAQTEATELQGRLDKLTFRPGRHARDAAARRADQRHGHVHHEDGGEHGAARGGCRQEFSEALKTAAAGAFASLDTESKAGVDAALGTLGRLSTGAASEFDADQAFRRWRWAAMADSARLSVDSQIAGLNRLAAATEASSARTGAVSAAITSMAGWRVAPHSDQCGSRGEQRSLGRSAFRPDGNTHRRRARQHGRRRHGARRVRRS